MTRKEVVVEEKFSEDLGESEDNLEDVFDGLESEKD